MASTPSPDEARARGRYVLENDVKADVLIARGVPTIDGVQVMFDDVWARRVPVEAAPGVVLSLKMRRPQ